MYLVSVLIKGLRQLHENQTTLLGTQDLENKVDIHSQSANSSVQHVQIRVAHLEDSPGLPQSSVAALQIPVQITHLGKKTELLHGSRCCDCDFMPVSCSTERMAVV